MIRPLTKNLIEEIMMDLMPSSNAAVCDFGIKSQKHYEALHGPIRAGEITPEQLDAALGDGPALTNLVQGCESNRHKDIVFVTPYDNFDEEECDICAVHGQQDDCPNCGLVISYED